MPARPGRGVLPGRSGRVHRPLPAPTVGQMLGFVEPISPADPRWTGPAHDTWGSLSEIAEAECLELLAGVPVGRVLVSVGALPCAFPVNHHVVGGGILFRTAPGTKLTAAVNGQVVGFEADAFDPVTRTGWSVLALGAAEVVTDREEIRQLADLHLDTWWNHPSLYVRIRPERLSGRRITPETVTLPAQGEPAADRQVLRLRRRPGSDA